jgi:ubiquinone/menaquinone biosynthesis C-methylase UbiE
MPSNPCYVYDPKSETETSRLTLLDQRTSARRAFATQGIEFPPVHRILDVGCGTGVVGFDMLRLFPKATLVGVDLEASILRRARDTAPKGSASGFVASDAIRLPFSSAQHDLVSCQYLLEHLAHPGEVLRELLRVTSPNGAVAVFEWDDAANFTYPPLPLELESLFQAKRKLIESNGGDRTIGRKLYHLLHSAGWTDIQVRLVPDIWQGPEDRRAKLKSAELGFQEIRGQLVKKSLIIDSVYETAIRQLYAYFSGDIFSVVFFFAAFGRKPA